MADLFRPSDLRRGFMAPKKGLPRRRNYARLIYMGILLLAGLWYHEVASDLNKGWLGRFKPEKNGSSFMLSFDLEGKLGVAYVIAESEKNVSSPPARQPTAEKNVSSPPDRRPVPENEWVKYSTTSNETQELLEQLRRHEISNCKTVETRKIRIEGLPTATPGSPVQLQSGSIHRIVIVSLDDNDEPVCEGGDYFETDLSGEKWKSRPPITDLQNGTYEVLLQVDEHFSGLYEFKVILLFSRFHGLHKNPLFFGEEVAASQILFKSSDVHTLPEPRLCKDGDYNQSRWSGRWTRSQNNESCVTDTSGRYQCLPPNTPCVLPWCEGPLDRVDSNGWVYSAHCRFKLFTADEAWRCLDKKWLFSWGDSTSQHTWQNLLSFIMDYADISVTEVPRRMDREWVRPEGKEGNKSDSVRQSFRMTMIYNGHASEEGHFQGLDSLNVPEFREYLRAFFVNSDDPTHSPPDILVMNSGLHDALFNSPEEFVQRGVAGAVEFWKEILETIRPNHPQIIYRTSVATAGIARGYDYNPQKMEHYNRLFVDSLMNLNPLNFRVVDGFDLTFPWHYDNSFSDGTHYGLKPGLGVPGHHYFVDHMFAHMLLNSICLN